MRCHICDKALTEAEIQLTPDKKGFEPCAVCMEIALDAAYSDGFVAEDEYTEKTHPTFREEVVPILEPDTLQEEFDFASPLVVYD
jgi:hypothetical protein